MIPIIASTASVSSLLIGGIGYKVKKVLHKRKKKKEIVNIKMYEINELRKEIHMLKKLKILIKI